MEMVKSPKLLLLLLPISLPIFPNNKRCRLGKTYGTCNQDLRIDGGSLWHGESMSESKERVCMYGTVAGLSVGREKRSA